MQYSYRNNYTWLMLMMVLLGAGLWLPVAAQALPQACPGALDYSDDTYGGQLRQLYEPAGHEHNLYHYRTPWNADNSYMIGVKEDLNNANWKVVLYDGDGCFIKELFPISQYSWKLVWDRHDPNILYTWRSTKLYRYHVDTGQAELLKDYKLSGDSILVPPSLNQAGDRIMVVTLPGRVFHSYLLPSMTEERVFTVPDLPSICDMTNVRYTGYDNYIATDCRGESVYGSGIYEDTGVLLHQFSRGIGHTDFSPNGQWAYFTVPGDGTVDIHVVNIDGTNDQLLYTAKGKFGNLHITWPDRVNDWFVVSFFPVASINPTPYAPPFDEILQLYTDGTQKWLARTRTVRTPAFWSEPLVAPSADGSRISFNGDCTNDEPLVDCTDSATIDQYILFTDLPDLPDLPVPPVAEANGPYSGKVASPINFSSVGSTDPDGNIVSYSWDFGDGAPLSSQPNPTHAYSTAGAFTVTLRVVDDQGAIETDTAKVTISPNNPTAARK